MQGFERSGFAEFDRVRTVYLRTRTLLDALLATGDLPDGGSQTLATETLPHIEDVEAGFRTWLRASQAELDELRRLVLQGGLGLPRPRDAAEARAALVEAMQMVATGGAEWELRPEPARRIAALEHARLVFALLPATPDHEVHYPGFLRSYADIAAPRTPGELAMRIEELERVLWYVAAGRPPRRTDAAYRRVYGFFDAGALLSGAGFLPS